MSVEIGGGFSIVIRVSSLARIGLEIKHNDPLWGTIVSFDEHLLVLGPLFEAQTLEAELAKRGLEYWDDYFDLPNTGGPVPDWCQIVLRIKTDQEMKEQSGPL